MRDYPRLVVFGVEKKSGVAGFIIDQEASNKAKILPTCLTRRVLKSFDRNDLEAN
jgi:hypothetical protein